MKGNLLDTDPQKIAEKPKEALANSSEAQKTAHVVNQFIQKTREVLKGHSWHPSPFLLYSRYVIPDEVKSFSEKQCAKGILGRFTAIEGMPLMLANALKMKNFGA